jgi:endonuclease/exonuclease/phosphatase family metal-dependent hydrolase
VDVTARGRRIAVLVGVLALAAVSAGSATPAPPPGALRVLQLNLCASGWADCYTGRSLALAAEVVLGRGPDVVTVNEICAGDIERLHQALVAADRGGTVVAAFRAAGNRTLSGPYRCRDGRPYGNGLLVRIPSPGHGAVTRSGLYDVQDRRDPEERAWLCLDVATYLSACTTHLASTSGAVALGQCRALFADVVRPAAWPTVVAGDLNLDTPGAGGSRSCLPPQDPAADDGRAQHVIATPGLEVTSRVLIDLAGTTDHPGLLVTLVPSRGPVG